MDNRNFDALVRRLEIEAAESPRTYNLRVAALAVLGYAYIGTIVLLLLGLAAGSTWVIVSDPDLHDLRLGLYPVFFLGLAWGVVRTLHVRLEAPDGRRLTREEAPALFDEAERLRRALDAPRAHEVLLTTDFNASVCQVPRLGVLGFPRNYLVVGLTLLETLSIEETRAVLAHEFAHLSHAHGRFGNWIYRVRATWFRLSAQAGEKRRGFYAIFGWFFDWYAPLFGAYSFVLGRRHEYEADRLAARVVGPRHMAQALVDLEVRGDALDPFWKEVWSASDHGAEDPPADVYARLGAAGRTPLDEARAVRALDNALKRRTDTIDTHPALRDRVTALLGEPGAGRRLPDGGTLAPSLVIASSGAERLLGASHARLAAESGALWQGAVREAWSARREQTREAREAREALRAKSCVEPLDIDERCELVRLTEQLDGSDAALPLLQALHAEAPDHLLVGYMLGRLLVERGDESGIALVERAMDADEDAVLPGCEILYGFHVSEGRLEEADRYRERATRRAALLREAQTERSEITKKDTYVPFELAPDVVEDLVAQLDKMDDAGQVWIARKVVRHYSDEAPVYVMIVTARRNPWMYWLSFVGAQWGLHAVFQEKERERALAIAQRLALPADLTAFALSPSDALLKPMKKVAGALVYDAAKRKAERLAARTKEPEEREELAEAA